MLSCCLQLRLLLWGELSEWPWVPERCPALPGQLCSWPYIPSTPVPLVHPSLIWDKGLWERCQQDKLQMPDSSGSACCVSGCHMAQPVGFRGDMCQKHFVLLGNVVC